LWTNLNQATSYVPPDLLFKGEQKLYKDMPANPMPLDYFKLYFTDDVLDLLVIETNRYAEQYIGCFTSYRQKIKVVKLSMLIDIFVPFGHANKSVKY